MTGRHHEPVRPTWACGACGEQWPCSTALPAILALDEPAQALLLWDWFEEAATDLVDLTGADLHQRFIRDVREAEQR